MHSRVPLCLLAAALAAAAQQPVVLESKDLRATLDLATMAVDVRHVPAGVTWRMSRSGDREFVYERNGQIHETSLAASRDKQVTRFGPAAVLVRFSDFRAEMLVSIDEAGDLCFKFVPLEEDHQFKIKGLIYPRPFEVPLRRDAYSFFPYHQGVLIPGDWDKPEDVNNPVQFDDERRLSTYGELMNRPAHWWDWIESDQAGNVTHPKMACFGAVQPGSGFLAVIDPHTQMDSFLHVKHTPGQPTAYRVYFRGSMGRLGYPRILRYHFEKDGGYVSLMKEYRRRSREFGYVKTLAEKSRVNPKVESLRGAVNLTGAVAQHDRRTFTHRVVNTFEQIGKQVADFRARTGAERASLSFTGWQRYGHDQEYPDSFPPMSYAGGPNGLDQLSTAVQKMGYVFGLRTDNYCDITIDSASFDEEVTLKDSRGKYFRRSTWGAGANALLCPRWGFKFLRRNFEIGRTDYPPVFGLLRTVHPDFYMLGNYVTNWECYDARHPLTRNENREALKEIFAYFQEKNILLTIEHHIDWALPYLFAVNTRASHAGVYGEDRQGPDRGIPVPLWQLAYHDCAYVTGSDYLHSVLWGAQAGMSLPVPEARERTDAVMLLARLHRAVGWDEMTDHRFLSKDYKIQETAFSSGAKVWVDFGERKFRISGVAGIEPVERQAP